MSDYFERPGLSSGELKTFYNGGDHFPEKVLQNERLSADGKLWIYDFERGNALEYLVFDVSINDHGYFNFLKRFFVSEQKSLSFGEEKGRRSKAAEIAHAISTGETDVGKFVVKNKDGGENKRYEKTVNALARECMEHPGRIPMTQSDFALLLDLAKKICAMPIPMQWLNVNATFGELFGISEYQREFYWRESPKDSGKFFGTDPLPYNPHVIEKKAMPDFALETKSGQIVMPDIKYTASLSNWLRGFRSGGWIQGTHYETGARACTGLDPLPYLYVIGVAGDKHTPPFATTVWAESGPCTGNRRCFCDDCRKAEYDRLCEAYNQWEIDGKHERGWLPGKAEKVWV